MGRPPGLFSSLMRTETRLGLLAALLGVVGTMIVGACVGDDARRASGGGQDASAPLDGGNGTIVPSGTSDGGSDAASSSDASTDEDASTFTPASIDGLTLWLDSTRGLGSSGTVTNWVDQATLRAVRGNVAYGGGGTCVPPSRIDGEIKGNPVVRFDGTSNCLVMGDAFFDRFRDFRAGVTAFIVAKPGTASGSDEALLDFSPTTGVATEFVSITRDDQKPNYNVQDPSVGLSLAASNSSAFIEGEVHIMTMSAEPGDAGAFGSSSSVTFYVDGVAAPLSSTPTVYVPSVTNRSMSTIGRFVPGNGLPTTSAPGWYRGDIGEIVLYLRTLDAAERDAVHAYLKSKWLP